MRRELIEPGHAALWIRRRYELMSSSFGRPSLAKTSKNASDDQLRFALEGRLFIKL
jgi:hypothetical protein